MKERNIHIHIIHEITGAMLTKELVSIIPQVGNEVRLYGERYYKVSLVVHVYDEQGSPYERVNIGVVDIEKEEE